MSFLFTPIAQGLTFKDLQDRVMTFGYNDDERVDVKAWLNAAQEEALSRRRWAFLRAATTITLTAGNQDYNLSGLTVPIGFVGFLQPIGNLIPPPVYLDDMATDPNSDPRVYWAPGDTGAPVHFWREADVLRFSPIPDQAYQYTFHYWGVPPILSGDGDLSPIPPRYRWTVLGWGALMYGADNDHNSILYQQRLQKFEQALDVMAGHEALRQQQTARRARLPLTYGTTRSRWL